jgi:hypothetical protein
MTRHQVKLQSQGGGTGNNFNIFTASMNAPSPNNYGDKLKSVSVAINCDDNLPRTLKFEPSKATMLDDLLSLPSSSHYLN